MELGTERQSGMGVGSIPMSKVWQYLDRFNLPDWWEPILLQADAVIVAGINREHKDGAAPKHKDNKISDKGVGAIRTG
jgi:hypothetical protein